MACIWAFCPMCTQNVKTSVEEELEFDDLKLLREAVFYKVKRKGQLMAHASGKTTNSGSCPSVCLTRAIKHTFWPRNLIFGLNDPWDMRKKCIILFFKILKIDLLRVKFGVLFHFYLIILYLLATSFGSLSLAYSIDTSLLIILGWNGWSSSTYIFYFFLVNFKTTYLSECYFPLLHLIAVKSTCVSMFTLIKRVIRQPRP